MTLVGIAGTIGVNLIVHIDKVRPLTSCNVRNRFMVTEILCRATCWRCA
jgi:hypothetical protein